MTPRKLIPREGALRDLARHERHLGTVRGAAFAEAWSEALLDWLENRAALGAQFGTAHPRHPGSAPLATADRQQSSQNSPMAQWMSSAFALPEKTGRNNPAVINKFAATFAERAGKTMGTFLSGKRQANADVKVGLVENRDARCAGYWPPPSFVMH